MDEKPLADQAAAPYVTRGGNGLPPTQITSKLQVPGHLEIIHQVASYTKDGEPVPFVKSPGQRPVDPIAAGLAVPLDRNFFPDPEEPSTEPSTADGT